MGINRYGHMLTVTPTCPEGEEPCPTWINAREVEKVIVGVNNYTVVIFRSGRSIEVEEEALDLVDEIAAGG
jgi:hypothetical protein